MVQRLVHCDHPILRRWKVAAAASLIACSAVALPLFALLTGFWLSDDAVPAAIQSAGAMVCFVLFIVLVPLAMKIIDMVHQLEKSVEKLTHSVRFDALTGLMSRSYFLSSMRDCTSGGYFLILDADNFKRINDSYGHSAGDAVLAQFADCIKSGITNIGHAGRLGGEEFGVFLPGVTRIFAESIAETIRARVAKHAFEIGDSFLFMSVSMGAAPYYTGAPIRDAISSADANLYRAKANGRNCVVFSNDAPVRPLRHSALRASH